MKGKEYLEYTVKDMEHDIIVEERVFDELVKANKRNYEAIMARALKVSSLQDAVKCMKKALEAMEMCEEQE